MSIVLVPQRHERRNEEAVIEKIPFIPMLSRTLDLNQFFTNSTITCFGTECSASFPAISYPNGDVIPYVEFYNHCFQCQKIGGTLPECNVCWSKFLNEASYDCHLRDCYVTAEENRNLFNALEFLTNGTNGLVDSITDLFPRVNEETIGLRREGLLDKPSSSKEEEYVHGDDIFTIERILAKRIVQGKNEYLIKWLEESEPQTTWEPTQNIFNPDVIEEFELKLSRFYERFSD